MMRHEGIMEKGHLQINKKHYNLAYRPSFAVIAFPLSFLIIILLIIKYCPILWSYALKGADKEEPELETCFEAL